MRMKPASLWGLDWPWNLKNRSELKGFKYRFALVSLRRYAMN